MAMVLLAFLCGLPVGMVLALIAAFTYLERKHHVHQHACCADSPYAEPEGTC